MSLNSVVNNLVRAASSVPKDISDADLDSYVAKLLADEAKVKEAKWAELGLGSMFAGTSEGRDSPDPNAPRPNKRFLASIIRMVDGHNTAMSRELAKGAMEREVQLGESSRRPKSASERERGNRLFGSALRGIGSSTSPSTQGEPSRDRRPGGRSRSPPQVTARMEKERKRHREYQNRQRKMYGFSDDEDRSDQDAKPEGKERVGRARSPDLDMEDEEAMLNAVPLAKVAEEPGPSKRVEQKERIPGRERRPREDTEFPGHGRHEDPERDHTRLRDRSRSRSDSRDRSRRDAFRSMDRPTHGSGEDSDNDRHRKRTPRRAAERGDDSDGYREDRKARSRRDSGRDAEDRDRRAGDLDRARRPRGDVRRRSRSRSRSRDRDRDHERESRRHRERPHIDDDHYSPVRENYDSFHSMQQGKNNRRARRQKEREEREREERDQADSDRRNAGAPTTGRAPTTGMKDQHGAGLAEDGGPSRKSGALSKEEEQEARRARRAAREAEIREKNRKKEEERRREKRDRSAEGKNGRTNTNERDDRDDRHDTQRYMNNKDTETFSNKRQHDMTPAPPSALPPAPPSALPPPPPSPPAGPPPAPIVSKMDKYFSTSYDPRLDLGEVPAEGLVSAVGWDGMLEVLKERGKRKRRLSDSLRTSPSPGPPSPSGRSRPSRTYTASEDEQERRLRRAERAEKAEKAERKAARAARRARAGEDESDEERERARRKEKRRKEKEELAKLGAAKKSGAGVDSDADPDGGLGGYRYVPKGGIREWDLGK